MYSTDGGSHVLIMVGLIHFLGTKTTTFQKRHEELFPTRTCLQLKIREVRQKLMALSQLPNTAQSVSTMDGSVAGCTVMAECDASTTLNPVAAAPIELLSSAHPPDTTRFGKRPDGFLGVILLGKKNHLSPGLSFNAGNFRVLSHADRQIFVAFFLLVPCGLIYPARVIISPILPASISSLIHAADEEEKEGFAFFEWIFGSVGRSVGRLID